MLPVFFEIWGCLHEFNSTAYECPNDISNAASTWVGLILGFVLGGVITWWVYYRQKKISKQQDDILEKVKELAEKNVILEESHEKMLKSIEEFQKHQETALSQILQLDKKIDRLLKK